MQRVYIIIIALLALLYDKSVFAQQPYNGIIINAQTKEPIEGATILGDAGSNGVTTTGNGSFALGGSQSGKFTVSYIGYITEVVQLSPGKIQVIELNPVTSSLQEVVVSANREAIKRSQAPVAITSITPKMIQEAKAISIEQVLNKVSGVYMVNLGNEQHQMSIRQPMTTKSLFLYLEDGMPIRTTGLFNHNALLEMNMSAVKSIEVIKGPSSSLYGSEAIGGVVNFITQSPTGVPVLKVSTQGNTLGFRRLDLNSSISSGKWGFAISGYYASKRNSFIEYTDYHKAIVTAKVYYHFNRKTVLNNSATWLEYYSDMTGGIDSSMFARHSFSSLQTFTYREVNAFRYRSSLTHSWKDNSKTTVSIIYRNNRISQNPAYSIKNDYRRLASGAWTGKKEIAHGEINNSSFNSYGFLTQHKQNIRWKNAVLIGGISVDISPSTYDATYIKIRRDSISGGYLNYEKQDSFLAHYKTGLNNYAAYINWEFSPLENLRIVASIRYDLFHYNFNNYLKPSSFSGSPDTVNSFRRISPKIGLTYNFSAGTGIYANYSEGFVPPQVTEMYKGVRVPDLNPSIFQNYEAGGWIELIKNRMTADISIYRLNGVNEIISVRLDDGLTENRNTGKTSHEGIEMGIRANPLKDIEIRFSGAYSEHRFSQFIEKGINYNGKKMNGAPRWMHNIELWYRPSFIKGLRTGIEWQQQGKYYMDALNTMKYDGFDVLHFRAGYQWKAFEVWMNVMNITDSYYSYISSKSGTSYSYTPAEPRHLNIGIAYDFGKIFAKNNMQTNR
jgi:outer membrane receptor protein involved in Fe transport